MKASKDEYLTRPFIMAEEDLVKIGEVMEKFAPIRNIKLSCVDGVDREISSVAELINFENPPNKAIKTIRFFTRPQEDVTTLWLRMDGDFIRNIGYSIEGKESAVVEFKDLLEERFSAMRPWYWILADTGFRGIIIPFLLGWFINAAIVIRVLAFFISRDILPKIPTSIVINTTVVVYIFLSLLAAVVITKIRTKTFPNGVFAIGQGKRRHANKEVWRIGLVLGTIASLAASILLLFW
jgi:hypothetical protein